MHMPSSSVFPVLIVHGGAGAVPDARVAAARAGCAAAVEAGITVLLHGGSALDAVQVAVRTLEDNPEFNAGRGSALTRDGTVETDAAIMEGTSLRVGAVGAVPNLKNPVDLARRVLEDGEHCLLAGPAAWDFAIAHGIFPTDPSALVTEAARRRLVQERRKRRDGVDGGTVGACAVDAHGRMAAATSTGGMVYKRRGRIGDSPLAGCGTYADDGAGAVSATGQGEAIIRIGLARTVIESLRAGASARDAAQAGIIELAQRVQGQGGVICIDRQGRPGIAHNTPRMSYGFATASQPSPVTGVAAADL